MPDQTEEQIRKLYAKDVKVGADVHTVFKAQKKGKIIARSGKVFLSLELVDRTGMLEARVFDNVEAAEGAFQEGDYLLVKGRTIAFHGKPQLVLDALERLDPGPIDPAEFVAPPAPPAGENRESGPREVRDAREPREPRERSGRRHRLLAALEDDRVLDGLDAFFQKLDAYIDERVTARVQSLLAKERNGKQPEGDHGGSRPKRDRNRDHRPQVEHRERPDRPDRQERNEKSEKTEAKPELARDSSLPKELSFKPFSMLTQPEEKPAETPETKEG